MILASPVATASRRLFSTTVLVTVAGLVVVRPILVRFVIVPFITDTREVFPANFCEGNFLEERSVSMKVHGSPQLRELQYTTKMDIAKTIQGVIFFRHEKIKSLCRRVLTKAYQTYVSALMIVFFLRSTSSSTASRRHCQASYTVSPIWSPTAALPTFG